MARFILDLDLTTFVSLLASDRHIINQAHDLSERTCTGKLGTTQEELQIINKKELSELIEYACSQHDGIIILTSGCWDDSIRTELALHLDLTQETAKKLENCFFHSPVTDQKWFGADITTMAKINKNLRLKKIIDHHPELANSHFVILDDNLYHINSFALNPRVIPIRAAIDTPSKTFYKDAMNALDECKKNCLILYC